MQKNFYFPLKYVVIMIGLFLIMPIISIIVLLNVVGINEFTIAFSMFWVFLIIFGPYVFEQNKENASIVIEGNSITNYINDGTRNFGWTEEINKITEVRLVKKEEVKKHFKNCRAKKAILINFGEYNIKYISVSLFTKKQIKQILKRLQNSNSF